MWMPRSYDPTELVTNQGGSWRMPTLHKGRVQITLSNHLK